MFDVIVCFGQDVEGDDPTGDSKLLCRSSVALTTRSWFLTQYHSTLYL